MCRDVERNQQIVDLINLQNTEKLACVPTNERALFLPHCMHNSESCMATQGEYGLECVKCGNCDIAQIKEIAEAAGYRVFIVPGGSMVYKILSKYQFDGVIGVACHFELVEAAEILSAANIPGYGIPLIKDGCRDTRVDISCVCEGLKIGVEEREKASSHEPTEAKC
ncbi:MAG: DUF116 domain-containing protein [Thermoplasmata archaeon]|nr:DUF116 domain-containing protein [Thermoplasmata archaeon]